MIKVTPGEIKLVEEVMKAEEAYEEERRKAFFLFLEEEDRNAESLEDYLASLTVDEDGLVI